MPTYKPGTAQGGMNYSYLYNEPGGGGWMKKQAEKIAGEMAASDATRAALLSSSPHGDLAQKHAENIAKSENIQKSAESTAYNKIKDPLAEASQAAKANSANMQSKFGAAGAPGQYGRTQTAQQLLTAQAQAAAAGK